MNRAKERILFLYLATGGGHISTARALAAEFNRRYSPEEVETHLLDGIPPGAALWRVLIEGGYRFSTLVIPVFWKILYRIGTIPIFMHGNSQSMILISCAHIRRYIRKHRITRIVNLHFLMNTPLYRALRQLGRLDMPAVTVVSDPFTCHPIWFFRQFTSLIVFSKRIWKQALEYLPWFGVPSRLLPREREVRIFPPVINSQFDKRLSREDCLKLKLKHGFSPEKPLILIIGGGEGLPGGERCLRAILAAAETHIHVAFICGRNVSQYKRIQHIAENYPQTTIKAYGFINFVYELMNMADIILAKAGPATIFEALMLGKPLIITKRIYGQEQGNVNFVINRGYGWYIIRPGNLMTKIREILTNPEITHQIVSHITEGSITNGTSRIVDYIITLS